MDLNSIKQALGNILSAITLQGQNIKPFPATNSPLKPVGDYLGQQVQGLKPTMVSPVASSQFQPTTPTPSMVRPVPQATSTPSPTAPPMNFNMEQYRATPSAFQPSQPPTQLAPLFQKYFPGEASKAATVASTENARYNPNAYNYNPSNNTGDYGIMQVNSGTLQDLMRRFPNTLSQIGVRSVDDLRNPEKNLQVAAMIKRGQGWGAWYGPKNKGFDVVNK